MIYSHFFLTLKIVACLIQEESINRRRTENTMADNVQTVVATQYAYNVYAPGILYQTGYYL
jgi:hypothetical protein